MTLDEQLEHIRQGHPYNDLTPELIAMREQTVVATNRYNASFGAPGAQREELLRQLVRNAGEGAYFEPEFRCEFGCNITLGQGFYANFDCVMLDGGGITVGDHVLLGPRVAIYTTNHSLVPDERTAGWCIARPVVIGDGVWVGGGVTINPGVSIGAGAVIGAGSVVTRSIPAGVVAAGVPARVVRPITEADRLLPQLS